MQNKRLFTSKELDGFYHMGLNAIRQLKTKNGILASSITDAYGSIFGRDSLIVGLRLLKAFSYDQKTFYLSLTKKILTGLLSLQGKQINIESGEEPGKCIHNFVPGHYEHLTKNQKPPWFLYEDGNFRNYDTADATSLLLICLYRYYQKSKDFQFIEKNIEAIKLALNWILMFGDKNDDGFIDFQMHPQRKYGGLPIQNWMDDPRTVFHEDGTEVVFPIATTEIQAYSYLALVLWSKYFEKIDRERFACLTQRAAKLKQDFNRRFVIKTHDDIIFPFAIDGAGKPMISKRSSIGHLLWASCTEKDDNGKDSILDECYIESVVEALMQPDIFHPDAGIRTLSTKSKRFDETQGANGNFWPFDISLISEGMNNFGFNSQASKIRHALFSAYAHFKTPIEFFVFNNEKYSIWRTEEETTGAKESCKIQAWTAASMIVDALALKTSVVH